MSINEMDDATLLEHASRIVSEMCHGGRWRMCIPVQPDDSDVVLGTLIRRYRASLLTGAA